MQDSPPYGAPYPNGMPPGGPPGGVDRPAGYPPGQHQLAPQGFIPPEASGSMPNYMAGGFRPPGMPPHLRLPPPGPIPGSQQHKRPGIVRSPMQQHPFIFEYVINLLSVAVSGAYQAMHVLSPDLCRLKKLDRCLGVMGSPSAPPWALEFPLPIQLQLDS